MGLTRGDPEPHCVGCGLRYEIAAASAGARAAPNLVTVGTNGTAWICASCSRLTTCRWARLARFVWRGLTEPEPPAAPRAS